MRRVFLVFCLFLVSISFGLFAQADHQTKGLRKIECQFVPITQLSKSSLAYHPSGKNSGLHMGSKNSKSLNWGGYSSFTRASDPEIGSVTGVFGNWAVPKLHPSHTTRYSACWVGIDGFFNDTVEQIGTLQEWVNGHQLNFAWFSLYPGPTYEIVGFPLHAHDTMRALVSYVGNDTFEMILENLTQGVYVIIPTSFTSEFPAERNSAEWIVEAPSSDDILPLAHFSPVAFSNCISTIRGKTRAINGAQTDYSRITMVTASGKKKLIKAKPSHLSHEGENFTVEWHHR